MSIEWIALGSLVFAVFGMLYRMIDQKVSQKQHDEFVRRMDDRDAAFVREVINRFDADERRIEVLEQTRPTTGELEARIKSKAP